MATHGITFPLDRKAEKAYRVAHGEKREMQVLGSLQPRDRRLKVRTSNLLSILTVGLRVYKS
ncbi:MAG: hypothetical protein WAO35_24195 [Terriglobia bacterium]